MADRINSKSNWFKWLVLFGVLGAGNVAFFRYPDISARVPIVFNLTIIFLWVLVYFCTRPSRESDGGKKPEFTGFNQINLQLEAKHSDCQPKAPPPPSPPKNSILKVICIILIPVTLLIFMVVLVWEIITTPSNEQVRKAVEEVNQKITYWKMEPSNITLKNSSYFASMLLQADLVSRGCAEKPSAQYLITIKDIFKDTVYLFDTSEYTLDAGGELTQFSKADVCNYISKHYKGTYPFRETLRDVYYENYYPSGIGTVKLPAGHVAVELAYMLMKVIQASGSCAEVLIRGYADGEVMSWSKGLRTGKYHYREIPVYQTSRPSSENTFEYFSAKVTSRVPEVYTNQDLPNLRAMFVKENIIIPTLSACNTLNNVQVSILDGYEFTRLNPLERKVHVYLMLY
jgi:hypothetical protein